MAWQVILILLYTKRNLFLNLAITTTTHPNPHSKRNETRNICDFMVSYNLFHFLNAQILKWIYGCWLAGWLAGIGMVCYARELTTEPTQLNRTEQRQSECNTRESAEWQEKPE